MYKHSKLNTICHVIPIFVEDVPNISLERGDPAAPSDTAACYDFTPIICPTFDG